MNLLKKIKVKMRPAQIVGSVMILLGLMVLPVILLRSFQDYQTHLSPLDEIDSSEDLSGGFLPVYLEVDGSQEADTAPTLEAGIQESLAAETNSENLQTEIAAIQPNPTPLPFVTPETLYLPERIAIPSIDVDAPIVRAVLKTLEYKMQTFNQWVAPDFFAVGWHTTSAPLGVPGNTVLNGHHNTYGEVFRDLHKLQRGAYIKLYSRQTVFVYKVAQVMILNERFQPVEVRLANATWILPSTDERLTLITCWPYESNTHRVIVVAVPVDSNPAEGVD